MPTANSPVSDNQAIANLVANMMTAWNHHDLDRLVTFYTPDYQGTDVGESGPQNGLEGLRRSLASYIEAFPDIHFVTDSLIVQGNQLALAWTARGTHLGKLMNIPPTGRPVEVRGVSLLTVENNKFSRGFYIWDVAGLLRNIGLLPEL